MCCIQIVLCVLIHGPLSIHKNSFGNNLLILLHVNVCFHFWYKMYTYICTYGDHNVFSICNRIATACGKWNECYSLITIQLHKNLKQQIVLIKKYYLKAHCFASWINFFAVLHCKPRLQRKPKSVLQEKNETLTITFLKAENICFVSWPKNWRRDRKCNKTMLKYNKAKVEEKEIRIRVTKRATIGQFRNLLLLSLLFCPIQL